MKLELTLQEIIEAKEIAEGQISQALMDFTLKTDLYPDSFITSMEILWNDKKVMEFQGLKITI